MDRVRVNDSVIEAANNPRDAEAQDSKKDWEKDYIKAFKDECFKICEEIRTAFRELGYPVGEDGVCIKHYNPERRTLDVVKRGGPTGRRSKKDTKERELDNPFFMLLREVHSGHDRWMRDPEAQKVSQNRKTGTGHTRFLAIGNFRSEGLPRIFSRIIESWAKKFSAGQPLTGGFTEESLIAALRDRSESYDSQLGMMICGREVDLKKTNEKEAEIVLGFIGIGSPDEKARDFLVPHHMHLVAGVADSLYPLMLC